MKPYLLLFSAPLWALLVPPTHGQDASTGPGEVIELSPWVVPPSQQGDYRNPQAVTASRIVADVKDIPLTISVLGEEFLRDTGTDEFLDAFRYTSNISVVETETLRRATAPIKIRGFNSSYTLRNGFTKYGEMNIDGVERMEIVRGPVSTFYGRVNDPGGIINYTTKRPLFNWRHSLKTQVGDNEFYKAWIDSTGPLWKNHLAYRVVSTYQNSGSWKDYVSLEKSYFLGSVAFRPISRVEVVLDYEYMKQNQNGGMNTALVANEDYLADYAEWQARAASQEWFKNLNSKNDGKTPYFWYNMDITTRYPRVYPQSIFSKNDLASIQNATRGYPWLVEGYARDFVDRDPRTGLSQEPILQMASGLGAYSTGTLNNRGDPRTYRYGWRMLNYMESLGVFRDGQFVRNPSAIPEGSGTAAAAGAYPSQFTGLVFPRGEEFNPNGPGAWFYTESHIASGEVRWRILENLNFRYGANYYEVESRHYQQNNSDTDMDGYTLEPRSAINPTVASGVITQFASTSASTNAYWTHQADLSWDVAIGETKHTLMATAEYRHDEFTQFYTHAVDPISGTASRDYPGFGLLDIFNDPPPRINEWYDDQLSFSQGSREVSQGYGVSYRGRYFDERLHLWSGLRHESFQGFNRDALDNETPINKTNGTTPMYGASYEILKGVNLYASYSESFKPLNKTINTPNRDPDRLDDPTAFLPVTQPINPQGLGYESGFKFSLLDNRVVASVVAFHVEKNGEVFRDSGEELRLQQIYEAWALETGKTAPPVNAISKNGGTEVTEGLEVDALWTVRPNWQVMANFAWTWTKEMKTFDFIQMYGDPRILPGLANGPYPHPSLFIWDDTYGGYRPKSEAEKKDAVVEVYPEKMYRELAQVPDFTFSLWTKYSFKEGFLKGAAIGGGYKWESKSNSNQSLDRPWENPAMHLFDVLLSYGFEVGKGTLDLSLNIRNIFDQTYTRSSFGITDPRSIRFSAEYRF